MKSREQFVTASRDTGYEDRASVFYNLGRASERTGDMDAAVGAYRRALELDRGNPRWLLALSRALVETGDYAAASGYYSRLTTMMQRNPQLSHTLKACWWVSGLPGTSVITTRNPVSHCCFATSIRTPKNIDNTRC